jgi:hypothetical protein
VICTPLAFKTTGGDPELLMSLAAIPWLNRVQGGVYPLNVASTVFNACAAHSRCPFIAPSASRCYRSSI